MNRRGIFLSWAMAVQMFQHEVGGQCANSGQFCGNDESGPGCCLNGEYCQPWNPWYYQCRPKPVACGVPETSVDYYGDDISSIIWGEAPRRLLQQMRRNRRLCCLHIVSYGWDGQTHRYLKSATGIKNNDIGAVSGSVSSPSTAAGPASCRTENGGYCGNSGGSFCCPAHTYCQPWNQDFYQCKDVPDKCSTQLTDTNFYGNDMSVSFGKYPWDCCNKCSQTTGCVGYTFVNSDSRGPACYLKSSLAGKKTSAGAVSGIRDALHVQARIRSGAVQSKAVNLGGE